MFDSQIASTFRRFSKLERTPRMIVFPIVTDLHVILEDIDPADPGLRNSLNAVEAIHQADELFHFDFFADLGDTGLGLIHNRPAGKGLEMLRTYAETHRKTEKPFFVCMGNHDFEEGLSDPEFFGEIMNRINQERGHHVQFGDNASYGCFDLPEKKIRLLFLNTGDGNPYLLDEKQLDFLQEKLQLPQGWEALLFMHRCPHKNGENVNAPEKHPSFHRFEKIVCGSGVVSGIFCGDSHFDAEFQYGGIPGFVSQGYGGIDQESMPECARKNPFDSTRELLAEIVVYRPEMKRIDLLRLGVQDSAADRTGSPSIL